MAVDPSAPWYMRQVQSVAERENPGWSEAEMQQIGEMRRSGQLSVRELRNLGDEAGDARIREQTRAQVASSQPSFNNTNTATGILAAELDRYGLNFDNRQFQQWVEMIADDPQNISLVRMEIEQSDEFKERFPGLEARLNNGYNAINPSEYLTLEDSYRSVFRSFGLPEHFYDTHEELAEFIANDVAPTELEQRVAEGFIAAKNAPIEVKQALSEFYGVSDTDGALASYYLDPDKGLEAIQREFMAAQISGTAQQVGFDGLSRAEAEELEGLGVARDSAREGFGQLVRDREVLGGIVGERNAENFTRQEQFDAVFERDEDVLRRIQRQRQNRVAAFGGRGGQPVGQRGVVGLQRTSGT